MPSRRALRVIDAVLFWGLVAIVIAAAVARWFAGGLPWT